MVEVVLTNLQRIDQLWPVFLSHVVELLGHPKASIRNAAVDALAKAVVGALSHVNALAQGNHEKVCWLVVMLMTASICAWRLLLVVLLVALICSFLFFQAGCINVHFQDRLLWRCKSFFLLMPILSRQASVIFVFL